MAICSFPIECYVLDDSYHCALQPLRQRRRTFYGRRRLDRNHLRHALQYILSKYSLPQLGELPLPFSMIRSQYQLPLQLFQTLAPAKIKKMPKRHSKEVGDDSEAAFLAKFKSLGWIVSVPFGENQRYDLVLDRGNGMERIQVKTGTLRDGFICFRTCSQTYDGKTRDYRGEIEWFGVYVKDISSFFLVPVDAVGKTDGRLCVNEPKRFSAKTRYAEDFRLK